LLEEEFMGNEWEYAGPGGDIGDMLLDLIPPRKVVVRNTRTGEMRELVVGSDQTIGEAIEQGQWAEEE
jgi:hypothetical protein